jgi:hypothetical protein
MLLILFVIGEVYTHGTPICLAAFIIYDKIFAEKCPQDSAEYMFLLFILKAHY